ncbi:hypothetical protein AB0M00_43730 [Streptomyces chartreusis]|uniref:hypothetical protein n=1 Tax=Streptomyces chartreusis TaxID=1969 RepID=UPI003446E5AB
MQNRRRRLQAIGKWQSPYVDAEPVRAHVLAIRGAGMSEAAMVRRLGLPDTALRNLMRGANGRPPGATVLRETADALLGYWPTLQDFPDAARIDPTGTLRRVHALETLGFSKRWMAGRIGYLPQNLKTCLRSSTVSARLARRVAGLYDQFWMDTPESHGVQKHVADRVRRHAASQGYHGPLAWDDDTIDDPGAEPVTDAVEPVATEGGNLAARWLAGEAVILSPAARREVLQYLFEWTNGTPAEIAQRLDTTPEAASRSWERIKAKAAADGRRMWRRVYTPRIKQNDMEEAA